VPSRVVRNFPTSAELLAEAGRSSRGERLRGHTATLLPFFARTLRPAPRPPTTPFGAHVLDPELGAVRLSGEFLEHPGDELVVVVHGLGGSTRSGYMTLALRAADERKQSCLLVNARGSDRSGQDISHAGLTDDLRAYLAAPELARFRHIDLFGYSLGGQLVLRYAAEQPDPRVRRVAAIGAPLLLAESTAAFDAPGFSVYRRHVMSSLHEIYTAAYQRNARGIPPLEARQIQRIREWDERVVAPRFGFPSADAYYAATSSGAVLSDLAVPALYVGALHDPMVPVHAVAPALPAPRLEAVWDLAAGHLGFDSDFDLGQPGPSGLEHQVLAWLRRGPDAG